MAEPTVMYAISIQLQRENLVRQCDRALQLADADEQLARGGIHDADMCLASARDNRKAAAEYSRAIEDLDRRCGQLN